MSASASKKKRKELEQQGPVQTVAAKKEQEQKKKTRRTILIFAAVIAVTAIALALLINGLNAPSFDVNKSVVTVGNESVTVPVYNYFYNNIATNFYSTYSYYGLIQTNTPLSQQSSIFGNGTYEDYFKEETNEQLKELLNVYGEAVANGYKLSDDEKKTISDALDEMETEAKSYGYPSVDKYLTVRFGEGCNKKNYEEYLKIYMTYAGYYSKLQEEFNPSADEISGEYEKDPSAYDVVTFTYATTDVKTETTTEPDDTEPADTEPADTEPADTEPADTEPVETEPAETTPAETVDPEAAKEAARAEAEAKLENMDEGTTSLTYNKSSASSMNSELADWLFDAARKEGDTTVIAKDENSTGFYSVRFDGRDDNSYKLVNAYVISIAKDSGEVAEGQETAEAKLEKLTDGLDDAMTDEEFETYVTGLGYSASKTRVAKTSYDETINAFLFDESRKDGEISVIYTDTTYYVVRFASLDEETYRDAMVKSTLWNNFYNALKEKNEMTVDDALLKFAHTDLTFYSSSSNTNEEATPEDAAG